MAKNLDDRLLLSLVDSISEVEWGRYQQRYPKSLGGGALDHTRHPPYCSFRFKSESDRIISLLKTAVESYRGAVAWTMVGRERDGLPGVNWTICPVRYLERMPEAEAAAIPVGQYMAEKEPNFAADAYNDLNGLAEKIKTAFNI